MFKVPMKWRQTNVKCQRQEWRMKFLGSRIWNMKMKLVHLSLPFIFVQVTSRWLVSFMVFNVTFNNIAVISWRSVLLVGNGISIESGGIRLLWWARTSRLDEMVRACKCFYMSKMSPVTYNRANSVLKQRESYNFEHYA